MKCIRCQNDSKFSERSSGTCPKCNERFAFEPKNGDAFTDPAFAGAIDRVSANGGVRFTEDNLYYELVRTRRNRTSRRLLLIFAFVSLIVGGFITAFTESAVPLFVSLAIASVLIIKGLRAKPPETPELPRAVFSSLLDRWKRAHGAPAKLVQRVAPAPVRGWQNRPLPRELASYSFDRAVICDRPETVDLLLANNFHFENNCAILSVTRYPEAVFQPVLEMLRRNPRIEVYALHDASVEGHVMARTLAMSPEWFRGIGRVTDVGLLVKHAAKMRGLWTASQQSRGAAFPDLTAEENAWLSAYSLELAAIRPEQVVKRLFRAMTQPGAQVATGDGGFYYVGGSFGGSDAGTSDGGGDSFG